MIHRRYFCCAGCGDRVIDNKHNQSWKCKCGMAMAVVRDKRARMSGYCFTVSYSKEKEYEEHNEYLNNSFQGISC